MSYFILIVLVLFSQIAAAKHSVNIYIWGGEIPQKVITLFEHQTGIKVSLSTYDSNETLYAKLRVGGEKIYDVILPSSYYVERMRKKDMLQQLDHHKITQLKNLDPRFSNNSYDPNNVHSIPLIWGTTGIFYNRNAIKMPPQSWKQLWNKTFVNQLLLLDDAREIFAIALMSVGYSVNDTNKKHIKEAYTHLLDLIPNIKLFSSEGIQAILIDEDATAGISWNGDAYKAHLENKAVEFVYPEEGFVIWVDCLAIPKNAPHPQEAYAFINFLLQPEIAAMIGLTQGHAITNLLGIKRLPEQVQNNKMIYPGDNVLSHGHFQQDPGEKVVELYNEYWQKFKLAF